MIKLRDMIYALVFSVVVAGLSFAADKRIDERVQKSIDSFQEQTLERQVQFYIIKEQTSGLTPEDKINREILERQLQQLREK